MRKIRQTFLFTLLATGSLALAPAALAETAHLSNKSCPHKVLSDPRLPIIFGRLKQAEDKATVRIPQPRRR